MCSFKQSKIFTVPSLGKGLIFPEIGDMTKNVKQGFHVKKKKAPYSNWPKYFKTEQPTRDANNVRGKLMFFE